MSQKRMNCLIVPVYRFKVEVAQPPWIARVTSFLACEDRKRESFRTLKKGLGGETDESDCELGEVVVG